MVHIQIDEIVQNIVEWVRDKARELGLGAGAIGICYKNVPNAADITCFDLLPGEDVIRIFPIKEGGSHIVKDENGKEEAQCFGIVAAKITAAAKAYKDTHGRALTSECCRDADNIPGRQNWGGCVLFPVYFMGHMCGRIYVAVSGGTEREDSMCAWEAYSPICTWLSLRNLHTNNPGHVEYEKND